MVSNPTIDDINRFIAEIPRRGELGDIFNQLNGFHLPENFQNDLQMLSSEYARVANDKDRGEIAIETYYLNANRITGALLKMLYDLRQHLEAHKQTADILAVQMAITEENFQRLLAQKLGEDFEIVRALSHGEDKYAVIYEVVKKKGSWNERFALKVFKTMSLIDRENQTLVQKDLETISAISKNDNNNLISVDYELRHFELPPRFFLSPFTEGENLRDILREEKRKFQLSEIWDIIHPLFKTVNDIHEHGLVHENLRPSNILLQESAFDITPWLFPPKIVKGIFYKRICNSLREFFQYWSPEQIENDVVNAQSDQFALALILIELFTGEPFFKGENIPELIESRLDFQKAANKVLEHTLRDTACPAAVIPVLQKMLAKEPEDRYPDLLKAYQALRAAWG